MVSLPPCGTTGTLGVGGGTKVRTRIRFVDEGGNDPGAEIEVVDRDILG